MDRLDATQIGGIAFVTARFIEKHADELNDLLKTFPQEKAQLMASLLETGLDVALGAKQMLDDLGGDDA